MKIYRVKYTKEAYGGCIVWEICADSKAEAVMDVVNSVFVYSIIGVERVKE